MRKLWNNLLHFRTLFTLGSAGTTLNLNLPPKWEWLKPVLLAFLTALYSHYGPHTDAQPPVLQDDPSEPSAPIEDDDSALPR